MCILNPHSNELRWGIEKGGVSKSTRIDGPRVSYLVTFGMSDLRSLEMTPGAVRSYTKKKVHNYSPTVRYTTYKLFGALNFKHRLQECTLNRVFWQVQKIQVLIQIRYKSCIDRLYRRKIQCFWYRVSTQGRIEIDTSIHTYHHAHDAMIIWWNTYIWKKHNNYSNWCWSFHSIIL